MSSKNNVCIYFDLTEKRRIKVTRISNVLCVWGTRIRRVDECNLAVAIQFVLYVTLLSKKFAGIKFVWIKFVFNSTYKQGLRVCLFSFKIHAVQEKFIAKLVNFKVNFTRRTDIALFAL